MSKLGIDGREIKPCHGSVEREEFAARVKKLRDSMQGKNLSMGPHSDSFAAELAEIQDAITAKHKTRIAHSPQSKDVHPFHCECHWCCHDEEFDEHPEDCPACQQKVHVLCAESNWSSDKLYWDQTKEFLGSIEADLECMMEYPEAGGVVTISLKEMTHLEWQSFLLEGREFEGFQ